VPQASPNKCNDGGEENAARDKRPPSLSRVIASAFTVVHFRRRSFWLTCSSGISVRPD